MRRRSSWRKRWPIRPDTASSKIPAACLARIKVAPTLEEAVKNVDFVQECGPETVEAKIALFDKLDRAAPANAILSSSSSAIVASKYTEGLNGRARCLVGHPVNPPHLVPIVELCPSPWTSPETMKRARAVYDEIGQVPITVNREIEGFILNRSAGRVAGRGVPAGRGGLRLA